MKNKKIRSYRWFSTESGLRAFMAERRGGRVHIINWYSNTGGWQKAYCYEFFIWKQKK